MSFEEIKPFKETGEHSYHRRAFSHDYYNPFIYHIILKKVPGCEHFGAVEGDAKIAPGNSGSAVIQESNIGKIIAKSILHLPYDFPVLKLHQFCVMPDHVHILLQVLFKSDRHLDYYIDSLKIRIASRYSKEEKRPIAKEEIFESGYCDKPLFDNRSLKGLYNYIRVNPHRLAMRQQYPQFFRKVRSLRIGNKEYEAYGNLFLFTNPDKMAVRISRKFSMEEKERKIYSWISGASQGTLLVSPFISKEEKAIRDKAEALGGGIILIAHEAFSERFKPSTHDFDLCSEGRLLIISLGREIGTPLTREICMEMNNLAETLAQL